MAPEKLATLPWLTRPVFVSSTFKDMQAERDHLRHFVFPRLEETLRSGRLLLEPIDLRQGVETTGVVNEEARERMVLKVCLEEIKRSRPFLIVLLGDRYGWVPPEERMAAVISEVGFVAEVHDKSVTALEIEFGILKQSPDQFRRSFFYFRDPLPYAEMPDDIRAKYNDQYSDDPVTRARHGQLAVLKKWLCDDPELSPRIHAYHANWDASNNEVTGLEAWGDLVYQHLLGELQAEISAATTRPSQTWEERERAALEEFIEHRRRDFTGRRQLLEDLTSLSLSETPPGTAFAVASGVVWGACLTGDPGSGKSAIFAELVARLSCDDSILLLVNAAGASPRGAQVEAMLARFIGELANALGIPDPLPEQVTSDDVDALFAALLGRAASTRRVVVLLDALNQFDQNPRAQQLTWLRPKQWSSNARLIATGLAGEATEALSQWAGIVEMSVPALTNTGMIHLELNVGHAGCGVNFESQKLVISDDVDAIAHSVWQRFHRAVNPSVLQVLKGKRLSGDSFAAGNPLWLTLALEQINLLDADDFARAEREFPGTPGEQLRAMQVKMAEDMPPTVTELYDLLIGRIERFFGVAVTRAFAAMIAVSRFGWRDTDLLKLIPVAARRLFPDVPTPNLNQLRLAELRRSFRSHLVRRGDLQRLDFFHAQMRRTIDKRILSDSADIRDLHRIVAAHLELLPSGDPLRDSERMAHLIAGDDATRAARMYADSSETPAAINAATQSLVQAIVQEKERSSIIATEWVAGLLAEPGLNDQQRSELVRRFNFELQDAVSEVADLGTRISLLSAAYETQQKLCELDPDNVEQHRRLFSSSRSLGDLAVAQGDLAVARQHFDRLPSLILRFIDANPDHPELKRDLTIAWHRLARLNMAEGRLEESHGLLREVHDTIRRMALEEITDAGLMSDLSTVYSCLSDLAKLTGHLPVAEWFLSEALRFDRHLAAADPTDASWQRALHLVLLRLGDIAKDQAQLELAQRHYEDGHAIILQLIRSNPDNLLWQMDSAVSFERLGNSAAAQGKLDEADRMYDETLRLMQQLVKFDPTNAVWQRELSVVYYKLAMIARSRGDRMKHVSALYECSLVLHEMKIQGMYFDSNMTRVYNELFRLN